MLLADIHAHMIGREFIPESAVTETPSEYGPGWGPWLCRMFILDLHLFSPIGEWELEDVAPTTRNCMEDQQYLGR